MSSPSKNDTSLYDLRKEETIRSNCLKYSVPYASPDAPQTARKLMQSTLAKQKKRQQRGSLSSEIKQAQRTTKSLKRAARPDEVKEAARIADANQKRKARAAQTDEARQTVRIANVNEQRKSRAAQINEAREAARIANANQKRKARANGRVRSTSRTQQPVTPNTQNNVPDASRKIPEVTIEGLMKKAIEYVTRTHRGNNKHKASVCVICDRVILGTKPIRKLTKDRIMLNEHRLSVQMLEDFNGEELNDILKKQYQVDGLEGILLSPRAHRDGDSFDSCHSCEVSLRPNQARKSSKPPKYAIANGFAIGYIPRHITTSGVWINAKGEHVEATLPEMGISGLMSAAISKQRPYGYCFSFSGGADRSVVGHYQFFETNQETVGSVINHFRSTGANSHILCVLCGKFTPSQRQIARDQCRIDTNEYIALITWLIKVAKHHAYVDLTPPDDCPAPNMLDQEGNQHNTDESQNPSVEDQFSGGTFTFTSPHDPTENNGVYRDNEDFTMAVLNRTAPILLVHGGNYVNTGKELKLESVFPSQFPFGLGGPKSSCPTHISEEACLKHYLHLSLNQFMRSEFILVVYHLYNRIMSYRSGLITGRGGYRKWTKFR